MTKQKELEVKEEKAKAASVFKWVKKGDKNTRGIKDIDLKNMTCTVQHVTQWGEKKHGTDRYAWLEHTVDLSKTDKETLFYHAVADMIIKYRGKAFKGKKPEELEQEFERGFVFRPENYPSERANGVSNEVKLGRQFGKASRLERIAFLVSVGMEQKEAALMVDSGNSF